MGRKWEKWNLQTDHSKKKKRQFKEFEYRMRSGERTNVKGREFFSVKS